MIVKIPCNRLVLNRQFVGFNRIVTEYLPAGADVWQLKPIDHDESVSLGKAPKGIAGLEREPITKFYCERD